MSIPDAVLENIMRSDSMDRLLFKKICIAGIPPGHRERAYAVLLEVSKPSAESYKNMQIESCSRYARYRELRQRNISNNIRTGIPPSSGPGLDAGLQISEETSYQIRIDLKRLSSEQRMFRGFDLSPAISEILEIISVEMPEIGYSQGMADLLIPFIRLECQSYEEGPVPEDLLERIQPVPFFLYKSLLQLLGSNLTDLFSAPLAELREVLSVLESKLLIHLDSIGLEVHMVAFRWFSCLFSREFELEEWYRFFDAAICVDINEFMVFFAAAIFVRFKRRLLRNDFARNMLFLQALREESLDSQAIEELIGSAAYLRGRMRDCYTGIL